MGFWDTFGRIAGDIGGSFIGDPMLGNQVMGVVDQFTGGGGGGGGSPLGKLGGNIASAWGMSGNQGGQNVNRQTSNQSAGQMTPTEPGYASQFRQGMMGQTNRALAQAEQPLYGQAQTASYLNNLNDLANASMQGLQQNLARSGALTSGRMSQGATDIATNRNAQAAGFMSQIPFLNQQARTAATAPLLSIGAGLAGKAPTGYTQSATGSGTDNSQMTNIGAPFMKNLAGMGALNPVTGQPTQQQPGGPANTFNPAGLPSTGDPSDPYGYLAQSQAATGNPADPYGYLAASQGNPWSNWDSGNLGY